MALPPHIRIGVERRTGRLYLSRASPVLDPSKWFAVMLSAWSPATVGEFDRQKAMG